ncbi:hypothetical protein E2C01_101218 [Portunus trituberculatus]|uniref:Uncharacterized protein n=1 Tax=Portunus trituberculatus TaxID=210409 RepID=A0A5B7K558_PORTR|nr:hypothetical protein [Portunus trituberculatus]
MTSMQPCWQRLTAPT